MIVDSFPVLCHSDDRREEESREHKVGVAEILRRFAPLDDNGEGLFCLPVDTAKIQPQKRKVKYFGIFFQTFSIKKTFF